MAVINKDTIFVGDVKDGLVLGEDDLGGIVVDALADCVRETATEKGD